MGKINAEWHKANPMPKNPTDDQRVAWHVAHAQHCGCRAITGGVRELLEKHGVDVAALQPPAAGKRS